MGTTTYFNKKGDRLPSVTTIIGRNLGWSKEALCGWAARKAEEGLKWRDVRNEAAQIGTATHKVIEVFLENATTINYSHNPKALQRVMKTAIMTVINEVPEWNHNRVMRSCWAWADWYCAHPGEIVAIEPHLVSNVFNFGGTPDLVCRDPKGELIIVDWKTGSGIWGEVSLQLAAYGIAWEEERGERPKHLIAIHLDKETASWEDHWLKPSARQPAEHVFCNLLEIEHMRREVQKGFEIIAHGAPIMPVKAQNQAWNRT